MITWLTYGGVLYDSLFCLNRRDQIFLAMTIPSDHIDDSTMTSDISTDDVSVASKRLRRGKASGLNELNNTFTEITRTRS